MSRLLPGIRAELALAVRQVNAAFNRLPASVQESIEIAWDGLDREIDAAIVSGDRDRALRAITAWKQHWLDEFARAAR